MTVVKISEVVDHDQHRAEALEKRFNVDHHYSQMAEVSEQKNCNISKMQKWDELKVIKYSLRLSMKVSS